MKKPTTAAAASSSSSADILRRDRSGLLSLGSDGSWHFVEKNECRRGVQLDGGWPLRLVEDGGKAAGRHLVAARALRAGQCVCSEEPFVQTVHDDLQDTVCHHCYGVLSASKRSTITCTHAETQTLD